MLTQAELLYKYNDKFREKFNPELFKRSDTEIIQELQNIILSCQRDKFFTIKVMGFKTIDDYAQINSILKSYTDNVINKIKSKEQSKSKKKENRYDYIDLKDSDIKLLMVKYYIKVGDESKVIDVIVAVPRVVEKFYFRINGNVYSAIYQIVDASTYNNSTSSSKKHSVTLKTAFQPIRIFRNTNALKSTAKEMVKCVNYETNAFSKSVASVKYIFAKKGYYGTLKFLHLFGAINLTDEDPHDDDMYTFQPKKAVEIYVSTPKMLFDNDNVLQHAVHTIIESVHKNAVLEDLFHPEYWVCVLGASFNSANAFEKGLSVLDSFEHIYDISTRAGIHLPIEKKNDIYDISKWMVSEFNQLKIKDNLNILTKKIRCSEYIASLYAMKLSTGIYRLSDLGKKVEIKSIEKVLMTNPMFLITSISRCQLVNYRNMVNDTDSMSAIKFTYKGISGIGEKGSNAIPDIYRLLNISNLGVVDPDSSSATDPGITGTIVPLVKLYDNSYFSEFKEPNSWDEEFAKLYNSYKALKGLREVFVMKKELLGETIDQEEVIEVEDSIQTVERLIDPIKRIESSSPIEEGIPLEGGGTIFYE